MRGVIFAFVEEGTALVTVKRSFAVVVLLNVFVLGALAGLGVADRMLDRLVDEPFPACAPRFVPCFTTDHRLPGVVYPLGYALHCPGYREILVDLTEKP